MIFRPELIPARLKARRKRFFADVVLSDGREEIAHCPNPGSMLGNAVPGANVYLLDKWWQAGSTRQGKLRYRWVYVENQERLVCVDTLLANSLFREALEQKSIPEFSGYDICLPEFTIGDSRIDFLLRDSREKVCFVEVKSVSMLREGIAYFPDSVTERGRKHLELLMELRLQGYRSVLFFMVQIPRISEMRPADDIDAKYGEALRIAADFGVEILVYGVNADMHRIDMGKKLQIRLF